MVCFTALYCKLLDYKLSKNDSSFWIVQAMLFNLMNRSIIFPTRSHHFHFTVAPSQWFFHLPVSPLPCWRHLPVWGILHFSLIHFLPFFFPQPISSLLHLLSRYLSLLIFLSLTPSHSCMLTSFRHGEPCRWYRWPESDWGPSNLACLPDLWLCQLWWFVWIGLLHQGRLNLTNL